MVKPAFLISLHGNDGAAVWVYLREGVDEVGAQRGVDVLYREARVHGCSTVAPVGEVADSQELPALTAKTCAIMSK